MPLKKGDKAPDFTLPSTKGDITLSEELKKGPVVIAFYPKDNTGG
jgi:peroxiredoxin Q/BCP